MARGHAKGSPNDVLTRATAKVITAMRANGSSGSSCCRRPSTPPTGQASCTGPRVPAAPAAARVPNLGASGAIAAVLGAFFVLYPNARIRRLVLIFFVQIPAWIYLGAWFLYQLVEGNFGLVSSSANGGGVAFFFAHVGGSVFGALVTLTLLNTGRVVPQSTLRRAALVPF
jgi:membrane associated rhomboid family serine protease